MGGACCTHRRDERAYKILVGNMIGRDNSQDLYADGVCVCVCVYIYIYSTS
jgi:hypothetical protein